MFIVTGTFKLTNAAAAMELQQAALNALNETRREPGCVVYEFSQLVDAGNTFRIYEEWESEEALADHLGQPWVKAFNDALELGGVTDMLISKFEAGPRTELG